MQPALLPAWLFLGSNWLELGQPSKAAPALRKVVAGDPGNTTARTLLGEALLGVEQYQGAAVEFRAVTEQQPARARGWYGLGRSYEALARAAFAALERLDAESAYVLAVRADALAASQQSARAIQLYRQALELRRICALPRSARDHVRTSRRQTSHGHRREILRRGTPDCPAPASTTSGRSGFCNANSWLVVMFRSCESQKRVRQPSRSTGSRSRTTSSPAAHSTGSHHCPRQRSCTSSAPTSMATREGISMRWKSCD